MFLELKLIPADRPIIGSDLEDLRKQRAMSVADALWLFSVSAPTWSALTRKFRDEPVDETLALLVRVLDAYPGKLPILPKMPTAEEMRELFHGIDPEGMSLRLLALMTGREASAGYRWLTLGGKLIGVRQRLLYCLKELIAEIPDAPGRKAFLDSYLGVVKKEAAARGSSALLKTGTWSPDKLDESGKPILRRRRKKKDSTQA